MPTPAPVRPLVDTHIRTEFGDVLEDAAFYDVAGADRDMTYVPGFSDMRRERDLELAAVASGAKPRHEAKVQPLPVNMRWTRTHKPSGAPDGTKQMSTGNLGYRAVHKDEIGKEAWLKAAPPGATYDADGSIRKGDTILMIADDKTAARNAARKAAQTRRLTDETAAAAGGLLATKTRYAGTDAFIRKEG